MVKIHVSNDFPKCFLIDQLFKKVNERTDTSFNFYGHLENFRKAVSAEVRYINVLFPEYTPHDEEYHLSRLFHVADILLGESIIENMNCTELFLIAISLYGHDWGMAVSIEEKEVIMGKKISNEFALLYNEHDTFKEFIAQNGYYKDLDQTVWQEYVRRTHAQRSGNRIIRFFDSIDAGVGEAAARISEGHWLDLKQLTDHSDFPTNFSVLGENINLRALAVYLRLIDLFDIGNDRTPYVIWKYVSPKNEFSKMEWAKHRALQPITCASYQDGRIIVIDGSTDNHNVYASLMDLKNYCNEQLRGCSDILAQMNDQYHSLNIYHAEWRIKARNFKPITVQFEFDRLKMFEVLSDEIYKGEIHIFLRELLQNSIDAIKMRKEILAAKGLISSNIGSIDIVVNEQDNGDVDIVFKDDGIGMDEYVVKNYLSVAGKSFYSSSDFKKLGLNMNPISKFGVGILSCFMVAEEVFIETYRDPYLSNTLEKLKIHIPRIDKQFRIESVSPKNSSVGTVIILKVLRKKLEEKGGVNDNKLDVTLYLSKIAGFVEYPIFITENKQKSVVLHPLTNEADETKFIKAGLNVIKTKLSFPYQSAFVQHSIESAKFLLKDVTLDLRNDLGIETMQGHLTFVEPIRNDMFLTYDHENAHAFIDATGHTIGTLMIDNLWDEISDKENDDDDDKSFLMEIFSKQGNVAKSSSQDSSRIEVFFNGIFVSEANQSISKYDSYLGRSSSHHEVFIPPYLIVNIKNDSINSLDISRARIISKDEPFINIIAKSLDNYYKRIIKKEIIVLPPKERLFELSKMILYRYMPIQRLETLVDKQFLPVCVLGSDNNISWKEVGAFDEQEIKGFPELKSYYFDSLLTKEFISQEDDEVKATWNGGNCVIDMDIADFDNLTLKVINGIFRLSIKLNFVQSRVDFVNSFGGYSPLLRKIYEKRKDINLNKANVIEKVLNDFKNLTNEEIDMLQEILEDSPISFNFSIVKFSKPFENSLMYGTDVLNLNHSFAQSFITLLIKFLQHLFLKGENNNISSLKYLLENFPLFRYWSEEGISINMLNDKVNEIFDLAYKADVIDKPLKWDIKVGDFVDGSIIESNGSIKNFYSVELVRKIMNLENLDSAMFGRPLDNAG